MSTEEVGAFILLLCKSWREEPPASIPDDDAVLARWARLPQDRWLVCKPGVLAAFTFGTDLRWHQKRQRREYDKLLGLRKQRSKAAKSRWDKQIDAHAVHKQCIPSPIPSPSPFPRKETQVEQFARKTFDQFWQAYPNAVDRDRCWQLWLVLSSIDQSKAADSVPIWAKSERWAEAQYVPHPEKFIRNRRWDVKPPEGKADVTKTAADRLREQVSGNRPS